MTDDSQSNVHSTEQVYDRVSRVEAKVAGIETALSSLVQSVNRIEERISRPPPQVNWFGVATLFFIILSFLGTIGYSNLIPVAKRTDENTGRIAALADITAKWAVRTSELSVNSQRNYEWMRSMEEKIDEDAQRLSALEAELDLALNRRTR